MFSVMSESV